MLDRPMFFRNPVSGATSRDPIREFADTIIAGSKDVKPRVSRWDPDKCADPPSPINRISGIQHAVHIASRCEIGVHPQRMPN
jgi:hypothetical protein